MKKNFLLFFVLSFIVSQRSYSYDWDLIADSIASRQKAISDSVYHYKIDVYKDQRKGYSIRRYMDSTIVEGDTAIIMEYHNPWKFSTNCVIWIKGKPNSFLSYDKYLNKNRDFTVCYWSIYMRELCNDWNIGQIRKEEHDHPRKILDPLNETHIIATRVIFKPHCEFLIDSMLFGYFYLYPRDKF